MKKIVFLLLGFVSILSISYAQTHSISKVPAGTVYNHQTGYVPHLNSPSEILITHSVNQAIVPGNTAQCVPGDDSFFRIFDLTNDFAINYDFTITRLEVGIEQSSSLTGSQVLTARFYTLNGPFLLENLTLLGSQSLYISDQSVSMLNIVLTSPVTVPAGKVLVVEVYNPYVSGNSLWLGGNATHTTSPSYICSSYCGVPEPATFASIGFPDANIVMNLYGSEATVPIPYGVIASAFLLIAVALFVRRRFF